VIRLLHDDIKERGNKATQAAYLTQDAGSIAEYIINEYSRISQDLNAQYGFTVNPYYRAHQGTEAYAVDKRIGTRLNPGLGSGLLKIKEDEKGF
jgi:hypothetical protein